MIFFFIIINKPIKAYINIKYGNNIPELKEISINNIYVSKALSFINKKTLPIEKIIETIVLEFQNL